MDNPNRSVKLCGVQGCCPTVEKNETMVSVVDDNGGRVELTLSQWEDLRQKMASQEL